MEMTTCWDCNKKQKAFCRTHEIKKNTVICELIQKSQYIEAGKALIDSKKNMEVLK